MFCHLLICGEELPKNLVTNLRESRTKMKRIGYLKKSWWLKCGFFKIREMSVPQKLSVVLQEQEGGQVHRSIQNQHPFGNSDLKSSSELEESHGL